MKNIKAFEQLASPYDNKPIKDYGQPFPFSDLTKGQKVVYYGMPCEVVDFSEYIAILKFVNEPEKEFKVNQVMFNNKGYIRKD